MKVRILKGRYGEGWMPGDIVNMDWEAARVRIDDGDVEVVGSDTSEKAVGEKAPAQPVVQTNKPQPPAPKSVLACDKCDFVAKTELGLARHRTIHNKK